MASYDRVGGFDGYLTEMRRLGARVFVGNLDSRRLVAEVDTLSYTIWTGFPPVTSLAVDRPRIIRDERGASEVLRLASASFGPGAYTLVLLVPRHVEARILDAFQRELARHGKPPRDFASIRGGYQRGSDGLILRLEEAIDRSGRRLPLSATVQLSR